MWLFAVRIFLAAALFFLIVVVHKVVFVVQIIFADAYVAEGVCDCVGRGGFEVLQERLEGGW